MLIKEIVSHDSFANFENDVQIGWYPKDPRNLRMVESYIFTNQATQGKKSSLEILDLIRLSYIHSRENRFVVMATYGHGKSHLALTMANFFGQPADSPEVRAILGKIEHCSSPSRAQGFRDFKEGNAPFLVVRLRGDKAPKLPQQFLHGLQTALHEQEATRDAHLPFWFEQAAGYLQKIQDNSHQLAAANAFLERQSQHPSIRDVPALLREVQNSNPSVHELCRSLSAEMNHGVPLDFGGSISLQYALERVVDDYCGTGKPYRGILILFDELSAFVRDYAQSSGVGHGNALQDILEGVRNRLGRATFVAFSQHDPLETAENFFKIGTASHQRETLMHQLQRLPKDQKYQLYSSLEMVLDSYLKQEETGWELLCEQASDALDKASGVTMNLFQDRYNHAQGWDLEDIDEILTKGCFPLHPLTTALLCSVEFREVTSPRSVLGFLQEALSRWGDQPALKGSAPNWLYPVELVDWFGEMLADEEYQQYRSACLSAGADVTPEQTAILKAMLLQSVARLSTERYRHLQLMHLLTGLPEKQCQQALEGLSSRQVIRSDESAFSFWPPGVDGSRLEQEVNRIVQTRIFNLNVLENINRDWQASRLQAIRVDALSWANDADFSARQILVTHEAFSPEFLRRQIKTFRSSGDLDTPRGFVFWLVAQTHDQILDYIERAEQVLEEALKGIESPPPVLIGVPETPTPEFEKLVLKEDVINNLPQNIIRNSDSSVLFQMKEDYKKRVSAALTTLKEKADFHVPLRYRSHVKIRSPHRRCETMLPACYEAAYRLGPPAFRKQTPFTNPSLRKAVGLLAEGLSKNNLHLPEHAWRKDKVADEIMNKFLRIGGISSWRLVGADYAVCEPGDANIREAWDYLNRHFEPGKGAVPIRDAVLTLMDPPYGYDPNHVTLLLSAWYGYHRHEVKLREDHCYTTLDTLFKHPFKTEDFLKRLLDRINTLYIERVDRGETIRQAEKLANMVVKGGKKFTLEEAEKAIAELKVSQNMQGDGDRSACLIEEAIDRLQRGRETALAYEKQTKQLLEVLDRSSKISETLSLLEKIEKLPEQTCVVSSGSPSPAQLQEQFHSKLHDQVQKRCEQFASLSRIEDYSRHQVQLKEILKQLENYGDRQLSSQVEEALRRLEEQHRSLKQENRDRSILEKLGLYSEKEGLSQLRRFLLEIDALQPSKPKTVEKVAEKRKRIHERIQSLEQFASGLQERLNQVPTLSDLQKLRDEILQYQEKFQDAPEQEHIASNRERCEKILTLLKEIDELGRYDIQNPDDVEEITKRANALRVRYRGYLTSEQDAAIFDRLWRSLDERVQTRQQQAILWLEAMEQAASESREYESILQRLAQPPAFLPPSEVERTRSLMETVQKRLDEDIVARISSLFLQITDEQTRRECLQELTRLSQARPKA